MPRTITPLLTIILALSGCSNDDAQVTLDSRVSGHDGKATSPDKGLPLDITRPKPDTVAAKTARVCGTVEDPSGTALVDHTLLVCSETGGCMTATSSSGGKFCLHIEQSADYVFHVINENKGGKHYIEIYFEVPVTKADIAAETAIELGKVVVPHTAKPLQLVDMKGGGIYDLGSGVSLTIGPGISNKPPLDLDLKVGAAPLKKGQIHSRSEAHYQGNGKLHMAVAFHPLETTFSKPVPFTFPAQGLTKGASVEVFFLDEKDGKVTKQADGLESGGSIVNAAGHGIKNLGIILVYSK